MKQYMVFCVLLFIIDVNGSTKEKFIIPNLQCILKCKGINEKSRLFDYFTETDLCNLSMTCKALNESIPKKVFCKRKRIKKLKENFVTDYMAYRKLASLDKNGLAYLTLQIPMNLLCRFGMFPYPENDYKTKSSNKYIKREYNKHFLMKLKHHDVNIEFGMDKMTVKNYENNKISIFEENKNEFYLPLPSYLFTQGPFLNHDPKTNKLYAIDESQKYFTCKIWADIHDELEQDYIEFFGKGFIFDNFRILISSHENKSNHFFQFMLGGKNSNLTKTGFKARAGLCKLVDIDILPKNTIEILENLGIKFLFTFYEDMTQEEKDC